MLMFLRKGNRQVVILLVVLAAFAVLLGLSLRMLHKAQSNEDQYTVVTNHLTIEGVPVAEYCSQTAGKRPLILFSHGLTGNRDSYAFAATVLAQMGFFVVTPDNWGHGERGGDGATLMEATVKTAEDFDTIIDHYAADDRVDVERLGLIGYSMGGLADYYYVANGKHRPDLVGAICATPDWSTMVDNDVVMNTVARGVTTAFTTQEERQATNQYLLDHNPYDKVVAGTGTFFYQLSGGQDPVVPLTGTQALYDALEPQGRAKLVVNPNQGHEIDGQDLSVLMEYFHDHLLADEPAQ